MKSGNIFRVKTLPDWLIRNSAASNISYLSLWTDVLQTDRETDRTGIITACFTPKVRTAHSAGSLLAGWKMTITYSGTETNWNNGFPIKCARLWQGRQAGGAGLITLAASSHTAVPTWWNYSHCTGLSGHQTATRGLRNRSKYFGNQRRTAYTDHPPLSTVEVKERVELYRYSPSGPSRPVLEWNPVDVTGQLKCDGTRAETRFRLSARRTSPFKSAGGASVQSTAGSRGVRHQR